MRRVTELGDEVHRFSSIHSERIQRHHDTTTHHSSVHNIKSPRLQQGTLLTSPTFDPRYRTTHGGRLDPTLRYPSIPLHYSSIIHC
ncbi:hypothetical protein VTH06DRAFT_4790 [Thermothelomyces fergusii]